MTGVQELGYVTPTPIQLQAIPPIIQGRDLIGLAQTGTGKTAAFMLPVLQRLLRCPKGRIGALVISPTRELAEQTCEAATESGRHTGLRSTAIYGGVGMEHQLRTLRNGVEVVIACPGRLLDHLWQGGTAILGVEGVPLDGGGGAVQPGFLP